MYSLVWVLAVEMHESMGFFLSPAKFSMFDLNVHVYKFAQPIHILPDQGKLGSEKYIIA